MSAVLCTYMSMSVVHVCMSMAVVIIIYTKYTMPVVILYYKISVSGIYLVLLKQRSADIAV